MSFKGRGFTLVELLVVIGIIAALAAVVIPNVSRFAGSGDTAANQEELTAVQAAMDLYIANNALDSVAANSAATGDFSAADPALFPAYLQQNPAKCTYTWSASGSLAQSACP